MTDGSPVSLEYEDAGLFFVCMDVVEGRQRKVALLGGCSRGCFWGFVRRMERDARGRWHRSGGGCKRGCFWGFERWMWLRDARGRWHRSGQGLRRGILLGLRETAKSIAAGPELACGSDSRPCRNNAVSRSPSSNHPSSAAARPDATFLWLTLPADRKKHAGDGSGLGVLSWNVRLAQNIPISIEEYRNRIGTAYHHKYRRIQELDRHNVPFWVPQHTDKSQQRSTHNNEELFPCPRGWGCRGRAFGLRNSEMAFPLHIPALKMRPA